MSRLSDLLREFIQSRNITEEEYAQRIVEGGWEEDIYETLRVLNDEVVPCHDIIWASRVVLELDDVELEHLKAAAWADADEWAKLGGSGLPGAAMALMVILLILLA